MLIFFKSDTQGFFKLNCHTFSFKVLRLDAPYPVWKLGGAVGLSAESSAPHSEFYAELPGAFVSLTFAVSLVKHLPGGGAFVLCLYHEHIGFHGYF